MIGLFFSLAFTAVRLTVHVMVWTVRIFVLMFVAGIAMVVAMTRSRRT